MRNQRFPPMYSRWAPAELTTSSSVPLSVKSTLSVISRSDILLSSLLGRGGERHPMRRRKRDIYPVTEYGPDNCGHLPVNPLHRLPFVVGEIVGDANENISPVDWRRL